MTRYSIRQGWAAAMMAFAVSATMAGAAAASPTTYSYQRTGSAPDGLPVSITMTFDHPSGPVGGSALSGGFAGLLDFVFKIGAVVADLDDLKEVQDRCAAGSPGCSLYQLSYSLMPEEGNIRFSNGQFDFAFGYGGGWLEGGFNTDFPGPEACRTSGRCSYEGLWLVVPEPVSAGVLAAGALGLIALRRRRARSPFAS